MEWIASAHSRATHHRGRGVVFVGNRGGGRGDLSFEDMIRLDLYYIENWSLDLDIRIILKTVR